MRRTRSSSRTVLAASIAGTLGFAALWLLVENPPDPILRPPATASRDSPAPNLPGREAARTEVITNQASIAATRDVVDPDDAAETPVLIARKRGSP
jgi:hypothetical protein